MRADVMDDGVHVRTAARRALNMKKKKANSTTLEDLEVRPTNS